MFEVIDRTLDYCTGIRLLNIGWIWLPAARIIVSGGCSLRTQCDRRVPNGTLEHQTEHWNIGLLNIRATMASQSSLILPHGTLDY